MKKHLLIALAGTSFLVLAFSSKPKYPEHYENPKWDAAKPPVVDEPAVNLEQANTAWKKETSAPAEMCQGPRSWVSNQSGRFEASGVKEHNVEVRGAFHRFKVCVKSEAENAKAIGRGWVDLSSWDSGLAARDRRVTRYVFGVEQPSQSVASFDFEVAHWRLPQPPNVEGQPQPVDAWEATTKAKVHFRGMEFEIEAPTLVTLQGGKSLKLATAKPFAFHFMHPVIEKGFEQMMALCNHHFLASHAMVAFDLAFSPGAATTKKP